MQRHRGAQTLLERAVHNLGAIAPAILLVDLGVRLMADQHIRHHHHARRHVGMDVEHTHDGNRGSCQLADGFEDVALPVVDAFNHHGAVQVEEDTVERTSGAHPLQHVAEDFIEDRARRRRARGGVGEDRRHQLMPVLLTDCQEAADGGISAAEFGEDFLTGEVAKPVVTEVVPGSGHGREATRLVDYRPAGDFSLSHALPCSSHRTLSNHRSSLAASVKLAALSHDLTLT